MHRSNKIKTNGKNLVWDSQGHFLPSDILYFIVNTSCGHFVYITLISEFLFREEKMDIKKLDC